MLLAIDVGNTNTVIGCFEGEEGVEIVGCGAIYHHCPCLYSR